MIGFITVYLWCSMWLICGWRCKVNSDQNRIISNCLKLTLHENLMNLTSLYMDLQLFNPTRERQNEREREWIVQYFQTSSIFFLYNFSQTLVICMDKSDTLHDCSFKMEKSWQLLWSLLLLLWSLYYNIIYKIIIMAKKLMQINYFFLQNVHLTDYYMNMFKIWKKTSFQYENLRVIQRAYDVYILQFQSILPVQCKCSYIFARAIFVILRRICHANMTNSLKWLRYNSFHLCFVKFVFFRKRFLVNLYGIKVNVCDFDFYVCMFRISNIFIFPSKIRKIKSLDVKVREARA